jgi:hypothetical protein
MTFENTIYSDVIIHTKCVIGITIYHSSCQLISESVLNLETATNNATTNHMGIFVRLYNSWTLNITQGVRFIPEILASYST